MCCRVVKKEEQTASVWGELLGSAWVPSKIVGHILPISKRPAQVRWPPDVFFMDFRFNNSICPAASEQYLHNLSVSVIESLAADYGRESCSKRLQRCIQQVDGMTAFITVNPFFSRRRRRERPKCIDFPVSTIRFASSVEIDRRITVFKPRSDSQLIMTFSDLAQLLWFDNQQSYRPVPMDCYVSRFNKFCDALCVCIIDWIKLNSRRQVTFWSSLWMKILYPVFWWVSIQF